MNQDKRFSDEFLNAFVDNQLAAEDKGQAYIEISQDEVLNRQVCELRKVRDLVQLAYRDVPSPPARAGLPSSNRARAGIGVAATVVLTAGVILGIQLKLPDNLPAESVKKATPVVVRSASAASRHARPVIHAQHAKLARHTSVATPAAARLPAPHATNVPVTDNQPVVSTPRSINDIHIGSVRNKVLIHVADDDPARLTQAMEEIEGLMRYYRENRVSAHVEVVINGRGLELVRIDTSEHAAKIARLLNEYDNLTFAACQNTIDRLKREQGITARLLPGVVVTDSGMAEIMRRQHQGWTYLQV
jgi:intracellular sulfur oxidation DsrE/DsrF family protein